MEVGRRRSRDLGLNSLRASRSARKRIRVLPIALWICWPAHVGLAVQQTQRLFEVERKDSSVFIDCGDAVLAEYQANVQFHGIPPIGLGLELRSAQAPQPALGVAMGDFVLICADPPNPCMDDPVLAFADGFDMGRVTGYVDDRAANDTFDHLGLPF
jgi:hypothetical protein